jgi:hypothetical protein
MSIKDVSSVIFNDEWQVKILIGARKVKGLVLISTTMTKSVL